MGESKPDHSVAPINEAWFTARASQEDGALVLRLAGTADDRVRERLARLIQELHERARDLEVDTVTVDLRELEFMAASCLRCFLTWLGSLQQLADGERYSIRFVTAPSRRWQRSSLAALRRFAVDLIEVEAEEGS